MTVHRYDTVLVYEPGIEPWQGSVRAIKPPVAESRPDKNGKVTQVDQWADVLRMDGIEITVPLPYLEVIEPFVPRVSEQEREEAVGIAGVFDALPDDDTLVDIGLAAAGWTREDLEREREA